MNRRTALKLLAAMAAGGPFAPALTANTAEDYRALVCVFLFGGLDCHDVLIPYDAAGWQDYARLRAPLLDEYGSRRARSALLPLDAGSALEAGRQVALPPELSGLRGLYDQGHLAFVANVGPLVAPTDRAALDARSVPLPPRLFSHNDQQSVWQASAPEGAQYGWGGLFADAVISSGFNADPTFTALTGGGADLFLTGRVNVPYQVNVSGPPGLELGEVLRDELGTGLADYTGLLDTIKGAAPNVLARDLSTIMTRGFATNRGYAEALASAPVSAASFPATDLGAQLGAVARAVAARDVLGVRRQLFLVGMGGFDTHSEQAITLPKLLTNLDQSLTAFRAALAELGLEDSVALFTASDFGRTLAVNGDGTDHGWGGHHLIMGGGVRGARVLGELPPVALGHSQDAGGGRLIPTIAVDQYAGELGRWFGLDEQDLAAALPNLENFSNSSLRGLFA